MILSKIFSGETKREIEKTPIGRVFIIGKVFNFLKLDELIENAGIKKRSGIPAGLISLIYSLLGISDAKSIAGLAQQAKTDKILNEIITSEYGDANINNKVINNFIDGLNTNEVDLVNEGVIKSLQTNETTKSNLDGVVIGDDTILKKTGKNMENISIVYDHSDMSYGLGYCVVTTQYADDKKNYPLFFDFRLKSEEEKKDDEMKKIENNLGIDRRSPTDLLKLVDYQIASENPPKVIVLSGSSFNPSIVKEVDKRNIVWMGISNNNRKYIISGKEEKTKKIICSVKESEYIYLEEDGHHRVAVKKGEMNGVGKATLMVVNNINENTTKLYVTKDMEDKKCIECLSNALDQEKREDETKLKLMIDQLDRARKCGIVAENVVFDRWYYVPWFINDVLSLGYSRVVVKTKKNINYYIDEKEYKVDEIKTTISDAEYTFYKEENVQTASKIVCQKGIGDVKMVFVKELDEKRKVKQEYSLMCTDVSCEDIKVFRINKTRWSIETFYREGKQNHGMLDFHMQKFNGIYAHILFVFISFIFLTVLRLLVPNLLSKTLGWIKREFMTAVVKIKKQLKGVFVKFNPGFTSIYSSDVLFRR